MAPMEPSLGTEAVRESFGDRLGGTAISMLNNILKQFNIIYKHIMSIENFNERRSLDGMPANIHIL